jgi:predicted esterase
MTAAGKAPHGGGKVAAAGRPLRPGREGARGAVILTHGRGATAESILTLAREIPHGDLAYLAPQAAANTWYPYSFLAPTEQNQPGLDAGLAVLESLVQRLVAAGIATEKILLLGFSQGACLTAEFVARSACRDPGEGGRRYGGVAILTGGLIGPQVGEFDGDLAGTPILLGSGDPDPHVPWSRAEESAEVFRALGAEVDLRRYPGMPHTILADEIEAVQGLVARMMAA